MRLSCRGGDAFIVAIMADMRSTNGIDSMQRDVTRYDAMRCDAMRCEHNAHFPYAKLACVYAIYVHALVRYSSTNYLLQFDNDDHDHDDGDGAVGPRPRRRAPGLASASS